MAETTNPPAKTTNPIAVVNSGFHSWYPLILTIVNTEFSIYDESYAVTDANGKVTFTFKFKCPIYGPRVLLDAAGKPILTFLKKGPTFGTSWVVFRGDSTKSKDIIFSTKRSSYIYPDSLDVFMFHDAKEYSCDFKIKVNWISQSCTIYARDHDNTTIAKMKTPKQKELSVGKEKSFVMVYPDVDQAFIVALVLIMKLTRYYDVRDFSP